MCNEHCENCVCLTEVDNVWVCDELEKPISQIDKCPEETELKEFYIVIHEVLSRGVTVKAKSSEDAKEKVNRMYYDEEFVLNADDFSYREMRDYDNDDEYEEF